MAVPQQRNQKKTRKRPKQLYRARSPQGIRLDNNPYYARDGHLLTIEETPSLEEMLAGTAVDSIEAFANDPNRILKLPDAYDLDDDIGSDLDDLSEDY